LEEAVDLLSDRLLMNEIKYTRLFNLQHNQNKIAIYCICQKQNRSKDKQYGVKKIHLDEERTTAGLF
jgi:hypothetical protein